MTKRLLHIVVLTIVVGIVVTLLTQQPPTIEVVLPDIYIN